MAENSVIISAEEEAKLLKPIDEYVEKIQKKIDALRVDGSDKVNDLKNQIAKNDAAYEGSMGFVNYAEGIYVGYKFYET